MKLVVGLGNPGKKYALTRHNVGFMFLDLLSQKYNASWQQSKKLSSEIAKPSAVDMLFAKPQTFMNSSGEAVRALASYYQINPEDITIIHDDLDLALSHYKITHKSPRLHNGIISIEDKLNSNDFLRIRIGIDNRTEDIPGEKYVLDNFTPNELVIIEKVINKIINDKF